MIWNDYTSELREQTRKDLSSSREIIEQRIHELKSETNSVRSLLSIAQLSVLVMAFKIVAVTKA